jgi:hypothetical protein
MKDYSILIGYMRVSKCASPVIFMIKMESESLMS